MTRRGLSIPPSLPAPSSSPSSEPLAGAMLRRSRRAPAGVRPPPGPVKPENETPPSGHGERGSDGVQRGDFEAGGPPGALPTTTRNDAGGSEASATGTRANRDVSWRPCPSVSVPMNRRPASAVSKPPSHWGFPAEETAGAEP
jgi:hypothetical protein